MQETPPITGTNNLETGFWELLKNSPMSIIFVGYLLGFIIARVTVILSPNLQVWAIGLHLHHYNLGLFFILLSIGLPLLLRNMHYETYTSFLFGLGVGIVIDETGLLLTKGNNYWSWYTIPFLAFFCVLFLVLTVAQTSRLPEKKSDSLSPSLGLHSNSKKYIRIPFVVATISYVGWFLLARVFTSLLPDYQLYVGDLHLQHFYLGIIFLIVSGIVYHYYRYPKNELLMASLYGGGFGLIIDQIAELLTEQDYWHPITYPFFVFFLGVFLLITIYAVIREKKSSQ